MVYTVMLKWLSFKMDILNLPQMLSNQASTYAILRHAHDIPDKIFKEAMNLLVTKEGFIHHKKLAKLVAIYKKATQPIIEFEEDELVETIVVGVGYTEADDIKIEYEMD